MPQTDASVLGGFRFHQVKQISKADYGVTSVQSDDTHRDIE